MYYFHNDYNETCHPVVLQALQALPGNNFGGYGEDTSCKAAAEMIRTQCHDADLAVHFLSGGTQTNLTVIASALRPHQAVIAAESGHIHVHETGAIEATGHKVIPLASADGKITARQVKDAFDAHWNDENHEHMPQPKLVYISQPTEYGTVYSLGELQMLSDTCRSCGLYLYVDGARLGYAMTAKENDTSLQDLAALADVFYIGGTKAGAMFGEAVVIADPALKCDFRYIMKQRGAMLAKGWIIGTQFAALLKDNVYFEICRHANLLADQLRETIKLLGYDTPVSSGTNQVFVRLPAAVCRGLEKDFTFCPWEPEKDGYQLVRFCTSWATTTQSVTALCKALQNLT